MEEENPEFFHTSAGPADHFAVEDLLVDFSNNDADDGENDVAPDHDVDAVTALADSSRSSSFSGGGLANFPPDVTNFSGDLCVPYDDMAELEWLSNFVEESFSSEDTQRLQLISGFNKTRPDPQSESSNVGPNSNPNPNSSNSGSPIFTTDVSVPAKARSKRSRTAACNWASRGLLTVNPNPADDDTFTQEVSVVSDHHQSPLPLPPPPPQNAGKKPGASRKKDAGDISEREERRCLHCATDKTPQWRTGPMGPKTLCNACGVRYKSGRLVPEYRPAASPTFVLTKHSNSHRKVMELRRQKETMTAQHEFLRHHPTANMIFDVSSDGDDYLIHQNVGPDFRQLI